MGFFNSCGNYSSVDQSSKSGQSVEGSASSQGQSSYPNYSGKNSAVQAEQSNEADHIDGVYIGSQNVSGLELVARLTISGNRWSASSQLGYDNPEIQQGIVSGSDLYDDAGMVKIGYVSGNTARINGYPSMKK